MLRRAEGILMLIFSGFIYYIIINGKYHLYMNPKFTLLTLTSAALMSVYGYFGITDPPESFDLKRIVPAVLFLLLAFLIQPVLINPGILGGG